MPHPLGRAPSKVIAVHVNYRSRVRERGEVPDQPSYFLKPPSSLSGGGDPLVRPAGCELLAFEGEIALVIGQRAQRVPPEQAWRHVEWVTAANDAGVHDMRYIDRGSNLRSKGIDGLSPIGPRLLDARTVDPARLRLRSWVNGELAQDATTDELLFGFDRLVADLSRLVTLEPGDVILTGTPTGTGVLTPGDVVEVEVTAEDGSSSGVLRNEVVADDRELAPYGAMPRITDDARRAAGLSPAPALLDEALHRRLVEVCTATLASLLRKHGLAGAVLDGLRPLRPDLKLVGRAHTLRYLPLREDLSASHGAGMNAQKRTIERVGPGEVLVVDARRDPTAGTIGDILALRARERGAVGVVTDGAVRDGEAIAALDWPTYCAGSHPAVLGRRHVPWDYGIPVACAGALVQPGDILVGDADGVVVVPPGMANSLAAEAVEQEREERFIAEQVAAGHSIDGLYPLGAQWREAYERWCAEGGRK